MGLNIGEAFRRLGKHFCEYVAGPETQKEAVGRDE